MQTGDGFTSSQMSSTQAIQTITCVLADCLAEALGYDLGEVVSTS